MAYQLTQEELQATNELAQCRERPRTLKHDGRQPKRARIDLSKESTPAAIDDKVVLPMATSHLCSNCSTIDLGALSRLHKKSLYEVRTQISIPVLRSEPLSHCPLCLFFHKVRWEPVEIGSTPVHYNLVAGPDRVRNRLPQFAVLPTHFDTTVLWVKHWDEHKPDRQTKQRIFFTCCNVSETTEARGRIINPGCVDLASVQDWIKFCDTHHKKLCTQPPTNSILTVIDCKLRRLVSLKTSTTPYVTLSYVWGDSGPAQAEVHSGLPTILERTIEDAMIIVDALGWRFLWVDRHCIPQDDLHKKHAQLRSMGDIYANSCLTIIAAAGESSKCALPGVSGRSRESFPRVVVRDHELVALPPAIDEEMHEAKWSTRGWTYQEGLLARRRLVFTPNQVYFQCAGMHCEESLSIPLESLHVKGLGRFRDDVPGFFPRYGVGKTPKEILDRISEYAIRELTYPSDNLNAFQGILQAYRSFQNPVYHLQGVVIFSPRSFKLTQDLTFGEMFALGLSWEISSKAVRRPGFPSWSWLGWYPKMNDYHTSAHIELALYRHRTVTRPSFSAIVWHDHSPFEVDESLMSSATFLSNKFIPRTLIIQAWMFDLVAESELKVPETTIWHWEHMMEKHKRMKDIYATLASISAAETGYIDDDEGKNSPQISVMILGSHGHVGSTVLFLRYDKAQHAYERLACYGSMGIAPRFDDEGAQIMEIYKLTRRQIHLV